MKRMLSPQIFVAIGLIVAGVAIGQGITNLKRYEQAVSVRGLDEQIVKSNEASWALGFSVSGNSFAEVQAKVSKNQKSVESFLISKGFAQNELQRGFVQVTDNATVSWKKDSGVRYEARSSVTVSTKKVDIVEKSKDQTKELFDQGVMLTESRVRYYFTDLNGVKPGMLRNAAASAREAGEAFARDAQVKLGRIKSATQGLFSISAPNSEYDSESTLMKKVRVVTQMEFFLD